MSQHLMTVAEDRNGRYQIPLATTPDRPFRDQRLTALGGMTGELSLDHVQVVTVE
jgi:hypothetical protein